MKKHLPLLLIVAIVLLGYGKLLFPDTMSAGYDLIRHRSYLKSVEHQLVSDGELPLWDDGILGGYAFIEDPQQQMFFPLNVFFSFSPFEQIVDWLIFAAILLAGLMMYAAARQVQLEKYPSAFASIIYVLSGVMVQRVYNGVFGYLWLFCMIPLLFLVAERVLQKQSWERAIYFALAFALALTVNYLQLFFYVSLALAAYVLIRIWQQPEIRNQALQKFIVGAVLAVLAASVVIVPLYGTAQQNARGDIVGTMGNSMGDTARNAGGEKSRDVPDSWHPLMAATFIVPQLFGSPKHFWGPGSYGLQYAYLGIIPLILAGIALARIKKEKLGKEWKAFAWTLFFTLLFSLGSWIPMAGKIHLFPPFSFFRGPVKMLAISTFFIALFAAKGMELITEREKKKGLEKFGKEKMWKPWIKGIALAGIIFLLAAVGMSIMQQQIIPYGENMVKERYANHTSGEHAIEQFLALVPVIFQEQRISFIFTGVLCLLFAWALWKLQEKKSEQPKKSLTKNLQKNKQKNIHSHMQYLLIAAVIIDLGFFHFSMVETASFEGLSLAPPFIKEINPAKGRVLDLARALPQDIAVRYGINQLGGYSNSISSTYRQFISGVVGKELGEYQSRIALPSDPDHIDWQKLTLFNVRYVTSTIPSNNNILQLIGQYEINIRDLDPAKKGLNTRRTVYLYEVKGALPSAFFITDLNLPDLNNIDAAAIIPVESERITANKQELFVNAPSAGYVLISRFNHPNWKASVDGKGQEIKEIEGIQAISVHAGQHELTLQFEYPMLWKAMWVSGMVTVLLIISAGYFRWQRLKRGRVEELSLKRGRD